jgi:F-type H+-transporting ATPase subunit epsilon
VDKLSLEIITPERLVVRDEVDMVEARGTLGEFGLLPGHARYLTTLDIGEVRYTKGGTTKFLAASGGFAEVADDKVTLLLETAEFAEEIDIERAKRAEQRAQTGLKEGISESEEYRLHEQALFRAIARIQVSSKRG